MNDSTPNEPVNNFTVPMTQPAGLRIPEFAIRQLIGWALGEIRKSIGTVNDVVDQLFALVGDDVRDEFKAWLLKNQNIYLDVSWPRDPVSIALIVVEPQSETEDTGNTFLGDAIGATQRGTFGDVAPTEAPAYAIPEKRTTNIYVASDDDRLTLFLYETVKFILVTNKQSLTRFYDVHNLSLSGGVLDVDNDKLPQFVYYRVLQASYLTLFDFNGPASGPAIINLSLMVDTVQDGQRVVVDVPGPGD
jgi:hypothetical protein